MKGPVISLCSEALFRSLSCSSHSVGILLLVLATLAAALFCHDSCITSISLYLRDVAVNVILVAKVEMTMPGRALELFSKGGIEPGFSLT